MGKRYWIAVPKDVYQNIWNTKDNMEKDISRITGKRIPMTLPKVLRATFHPKYNENFIQVDIKKLVDLAKKKRRSH